MVTDVAHLVGVGLGPFNLSLAALASTVPGLRAVYCEREPEFRWHPGMLIEGATIQVPFLADLVSLVDPTHPLSFLNYVARQGRLFPFYFAERFHLDRAEYQDYCRWAVAQLPGCRFDQDVCAIDWSAGHGAFVVRTQRTELLARNVVLGVGTAPEVPTALRRLAEDPAVPVLHSADYLRQRQALLAAEEVVVVGAGQSGAEVVLDLVRRRPAGRERVRWLCRTPAMAPMEYSALGLEHFTPDYTGYFHALPEPARDRLLPAQWQLYKGISAGTMADIQQELYRRSVETGWPDVTIAPGVEVVSATHNGRIELDLAHAESGGRDRIHADAVVSATGYRERPVDDLLGPLAQQIGRDHAGRPTVDRHYRLDLPGLDGDIYVQNAERHTHGVGAPDLGLGAWRAATILNSLCGRPVYPLPSRTAFTTFGLPTGPHHDHRG